jgi:hypothetical protein
MNPPARIVLLFVRNCSPSRSVRHGNLVALNTLRIAKQR